MLVQDYEFESLSAQDEEDLDLFYNLYKQNFPLVDEQETFENFVRCLQLNDDFAKQEKYGPYHEYYLAVRGASDDGRRPRKIVGGLVFGVCTSKEHVEHGYLCSVQAIYFFRSNDDGADDAQGNLTRFLLKDRSFIEKIIQDYALKACNLTRFQKILSGTKVEKIAILFEANNPVRMTPRQKQQDVDLSHVHPAIRYKFWLTHRTAPLDFCYVQPPLSESQAAIEYLDLFIVGAAPRPGRLDENPKSRSGCIEGPVLAAHLRRFFCISVLKGQSAQIGRKFMPAADGKAARDSLTVDEYCDMLAEMPRIGVLSQTDPALKRIREEALEQSITASRARKTVDDEGWLAFAVKHFIHRYDLPVSAGMTLLVLGASYIRAVMVAERAEDVHRISVVCTVSALAVIAAWSRLHRRKRERNDRAYRRLITSIGRIQRKIPRYKGHTPSVVLREILRDRAEHLELALPLERAALEKSGVSAGRACDFFLALANAKIPHGVNSLAVVLAQFPMGLAQSLYDLTRWDAYLTVIFPVSPELVDPSQVALAYTRLADPHQWLDTEMARCILKADKRRLDSLAALPAGRRACLYLPFVIDWAWRDIDLGNALDRLCPWEGSPVRFIVSELQREVGPYLSQDAELACGRILAVLCHLALVLGRLAPKRQITTELLLPCTLLIHARTDQAASFLEHFGFLRVPRPHLAEPEPHRGMLDGWLMSQTLMPGSFTDEESGTENSEKIGTTFFGLVGELTKTRKAEPNWAAYTDRR